jgi:hypothetical protein
MTEGQGPALLAGVNGTALAAAVRRAFHLLREGEPKILRDEFALPLSGVSLEDVMAMPFPDQTSAGRLTLRGIHSMLGRQEEAILDADPASTARVSDLDNG